MLLVRVVCKMLMTVLLCDGPGSGFQIIGLFANGADAQSYAKDHSLKDWRVAEVYHRRHSQKAKWRRLRRPISDCFLPPQPPAASLSPSSFVNSLRVDFLDGQSHRAQTPAVLDHSRALPQGDGSAGPAFGRRRGRWASATW